MSTADDSPTLTQIRAKAAELRASLAEYGATNVEVFGSVARGDDHEKSDIDLLVDLTSTTGLFDLLRMQSAAELLLGRPVDIVPRAALKPELADTIRSEAVSL